MVNSTNKQNDPWYRNIDIMFIKNGVRIIHVNKEGDLAREIIISILIINYNENILCLIEDIKS